VESSFSLVLNNFLSNLNYQIDKLDFISKGILGQQKCLYLRLKYLKAVSISLSMFTY
jgi:hypothetical protein